MPPPTNDILGLGDIGGSLLAGGKPVADVLPQLNASPLTQVPTLLSGDDPGHPTTATDTDPFDGVPIGDGMIGRGGAFGPAEGGAGVEEKRHTRPL